MAYRNGKSESTASKRLHQCVSEFKDEFTPGNKVLCCQACGKSIVAQQRPLVTQHLSGSERNIAVVGLKVRPGRQSLIGDSSAKISSSEPSKFATSATDTCKAFVSGDTAYYQLKRGCKDCYWCFKNDQTASEKSFLSSWQDMSAVNHTMIACVINEVPQTLWPDVVKFDNFLPLVTDAAHYTKQSGRRTYSELS
jgi:hypothetical protein